MIVLLYFTLISHNIIMTFSVCFIQLLRARCQIYFFLCRKGYAHTAQSSPRIWSDDGVQSPLLFFLHTSTNVFPAGKTYGYAVYVWWNYHPIKSRSTTYESYPHKPPDYRHTDKVHGLVLVLLAVNLRVITFCCTWQAEPLISTLKFDLDLWPWPRPWPTSKAIGDKQWSQTRSVIVQSWPLTYDLDLLSQLSQGQGRPPCKRWRS